MSILSINENYFILYGYLMQLREIFRSEFYTAYVEVIIINLIFLKKYSSKSSYLRILIGLLSLKDHTHKEYSGIKHRFCIT